MGNWKKGTKLNNGQYTIESILLRGGYGLFYRAKETKTNRLVTIIANKVFWQEQENAEKLQEKFIRQAGTIASIKASGELGRRIRDMGLVPGKKISIQGRAPLLDPVSLRIMGFTLTLRNNEADHIMVEVSS